MKIAVLVKEVPDTYGERRLNLETGIADRAASDSVLDEIGERAMEVALSYADAHPGAEIVVISMAPESAASTVRKGLAMGATSAIQVVDEGLLGADLGLTAETLAAAIRQVGPDLVIAGNQSTDGTGGVIAAMVAEILDFPHLTNLTQVEISEAEVLGVRASDYGTMELKSALPAVISITESFPDGRFPNFKGIMAAKKKPLEIRSLSDLGIDPLDSSASRSIMLAVSERPPREAGIKITDEGDAGIRLANFLSENRLA